jgi:crotonobetainyl-CoA:carnitine CoA-transferase CaiB-like acyl-CoA transferase
MGNRHPSIAPYETFRASDGYSNLAVGNDAQFKKLCELLSLAVEPRFATNAQRVENREAMLAILEPIFAKQTVKEWVATLEGAGIPAGGIHDIPTALAHPQLAARGRVRKVRHAAAGELRLVGSPLPLAGVSDAIAAPPQLGEHTLSVLRDELGFAEAEIRRMAAEGVIGL